MDTMKLNTPILVAAEVNNLIEKYGIGAVKAALSFIETFPTAVVNIVRVNGFEYKLNDGEMSRIKSIAGYNGVNKIQAIKLFRDITGCGLNEAKYAVESMIDNGIFRT